MAGALQAALEKWLNDAVRIPYIRMDASFRDFISETTMDWGRVPEKDSLNLHNEEPKVGARAQREAEEEGSGGERGLRPVPGVHAAREVPGGGGGVGVERRGEPSALKAFKLQVEKLVTVTESTVTAVQTMVARQNAFIQSIDVMSTNLKELVATTQQMNYTSLKVPPSIQEHNDTIAKTLDTAANACDQWFTAADFVPTRGGRTLDAEMNGILLQAQGLAELFQRRWNYLVGVRRGGERRRCTRSCGTRRTRCSSRRRWRSGRATARRWGR